MRDLRTWEATQPDEQFKRATELIAEFELIVQPGGVLDIEDLQGRRMMFFLHAMPLAATHSELVLFELSYPFARVAHLDPSDKFT